MEGSDTNTHKVSDSGYSNSCNSQSQRSSGSSKSHHSNSSGSSGYGGHPSTLGSGTEVFPQPPVSKHDKEHKKKKLKSTSVTTATDHHVESKTLLTSPTTVLENIPEGNKSASKSLNKTTNQVVVKATGQTCTASGAATSDDVQIRQPALSCLSQTAGKNVPPAIPEETESGISRVTVDVTDQEVNLNCHHNSDSVTPQAENEFSTIVSLNDGVVMYTTSSITDVLGFPKDMWLGRSFIDFVHPKDRMAFASHITTGIALPVEENRNKASLAAKESFYCCLRQYRGLKSTGFGVTEKKVTYLPFHLTMSFRDVSNTEKMGLVEEETGIQGPFLIILATLVKSAYTYPDETKVSSKFIMRHHASCQLSHVDPEVVQYLGYLPQDICGRSVFEFYHPEDSPYLKEVYEGVIKAQGQPFRSKPYRFRAQNGGYVLLDTEWSAFINPWSRKLEFIIGQNRVLKGPTNPGIFSPPNPEDTLQVSEEVLKESKVIQQEIETLLRETIQRTTEEAKQQASKRCKDLAAFMENLMEDVAKPELKVDLPTEEQSFSERDSVMLGEISPHHDYYDNKSTSETPPSYNQLNYNENIQRFFESKPKTTLSDESGESKTEANRSHNSTDEEGKSVPVADSSLDSSNRKCCSPVNGSGSGGSSGSAGMPGSAASRGDTSATNTSHGSYKPHHLTEALLCRHNEDMEKQMVQKHREKRSKGDSKKKMSHEKLQEQNHGVKRSGSHSWEGEPFKASKHPHVENMLASGNAVPVPNVAAIGSTTQLPSIYPGSPNVNLWPPFSVTVTPIQSTQPCLAHNSFSGGTIGSTQSPQLASMIPVYYIPTGSQQASLPPRGLTPQEHPGPPPVGSSGMLLPGQPQYIPSQVPVINPLPSMLYHPMQPMYGAPPMMYSSLMLQSSTILPAPISQTGLLTASSRSMMKQDKPPTESGTPSGVGPATKFQRPASQATSVKAEPGSAMGSIASASIKRAMSECSKKDKSLCSPGPQTSPSPDEEKIKEGQRNINFGPAREIENTTGDESSYSSFYSFLRTDKSDESMKSSLRDKDFPYPCKPEGMNWEKNESNNRLPSLDKPRPVLKDPPWLEQVKVTPELMYRYQINERNLESVLESDLQTLKDIQQPLLVNDQLSQLYLDMELEGLSTKLKLEEGITSSSSGSSGGSGDEVRCSTQNKRKRRSLKYSKFMMIFEENAPFPPPVS